MEAKGYNIESGYIGYVNGIKRFFSCEADYREYIEEDSNDEE